MIGAKSVPALPKKYSTPRAARSSRYASAVVSMSAFLLMSAPAVSLQPKSQHPPRVPLVDLRFFGGRSDAPASAQSSSAQGFGGAPSKPSCLQRAATDSYTARRSRG